VKLPRHVPALITYGDLRHLVMAAFGRDTPKLASFGFPPPKLPTLTSEQRSRAALRAAAAPATHS
jgi:hypothetical protein